MGEQAPKTEVFSYERLFEVLRSEKNNPNLQKLHPTYFDDISAYLKEKEQQITQSMSASNVFTVDETENLQTQLRNARRIVRMIFDLREKKIMQMALNKSRTSSSIIDTSNLMESEIHLFKDMLNVLDKYRHNELLPLVDPKKSVPIDAKVPETPSLVTQEKPVEPEGLMLIRALEDIPVLVGPDLREYGPFAPEDVASVPVEVGKALVEAHKAQQIRPTS